MTSGCPVCGASLAGRRAGARYCSAACRREASRWRRLSAGERDGHYVSLAQYVQRRRRRANRFGEA